MGKRSISVEIRDEIIGKVKLGERVKEVSQRYGVKESTIYGFLRQKATGE